MGLLNWLRTRSQSDEATRRSLAMNDDRELIASQVPELAGMGMVEGMAYALQQIEVWKTQATPDQVSEFINRGKRSIASFETEGLTMPYWGSLWVLRTYQRELGLDVPAVAPSNAGGAA
jgi:hypothetical protein